MSKGEVLLSSICLHDLTIEGGSYLSSKQFKIWLLKSKRYRDWHIKEKNYTTNMIAIHFQKNYSYYTLDEFYTLNKKRKRLIV